MLSLSAASSIRQIGEAALCPFEAKPDRDDTRIPATITQLTCKHAKSAIANVDGSGAPMGVSCEQIGGTCKQIHTILGVSYKQSATNRSSRSLRRPRRSLRRHHNIRVNSACVCVLSNGKPAVPVSPGYEARR
jgi:Interleukin-17